MAPCDTSSGYALLATLAPGASAGVTEVFVFDVNEPLVFGYVSRIPISVAKQEIELDRAIKHQDYAKLWDTYHIRYIATKDMIEYENPFVSVELVYQGGGVNIYRLGLNSE